LIVEGLSLSRSGWSLRLAGSSVVLTFSLLEGSIGSTVLSATNGFGFLILKVLVVINSVEGTVSSFVTMAALLTGLTSEITAFEGLEVIIAIVLLRSLLIASRFEAIRPSVQVLSATLGSFSTEETILSIERAIRITLGTSEATRTSEISGCSCCKNSESEFHFFLIYRIRN